MRAMGISEWVEVGDKGEAYMVEFRANVKKLDARAGELFTQYQTHVGRAQGGDSDTRSRSIGRARQILRQIRGMVRRAPSFAEYTIFSEDWFNEQERMLRELAKNNN